MEIWNHAQMDAGCKITMTTQCAYDWKMKTYDCLECVFLSYLRGLWVKSLTFAWRVMPKMWHSFTQLSHTTRHHYIFFSLTQCCWCCCQVTLKRLYALSDINIHTQIHALCLYYFIIYKDDMCLVFNAVDGYAFSCINVCFHILLNSYHNH